MLFSHWRISYRAEVSGGQNIVVIYAWVHYRFFIPYTCIYMQMRLSIYSHNSKVCARIDILFIYYVCMIFIRLAMPWPHMTNTTPNFLWLDLIWVERPQMCHVLTEIMNMYSNLQRLECAFKLLRFYCVHVHSSCVIVCTCMYVRVYLCIPLMVGSFKVWPCHPHCEWNTT